MNEQLLQIGDEVVIKVEKESREWGYNPCPDGTKAKVVGFSEIHYGRIDNFGHKPGVYQNRCWVKVLLPDGTEYEENHTRLAFVDKALMEKRLEALRKLKQSWETLRKEGFLRDLPETPFWEGDVVRAKNGPSYLGSFRYVVQRVDYPHLNERTNPGTMWPCYQLAANLDSSCSISASEDQIELVSRGRIWKYYHKEPIEFDDTYDEAKFFMMLGHTDEVRNPRTKNYAWDKLDALDAVREGIAHGFKMRGNVPGTVVKFRNQKLGRRVAKATLKGLEL